MPQIKTGLHVVPRSTKSGVNADPIVGGRPRVPVDFAMVLRMRDVYHWGWSRMAKEYILETKQFISPDTMKRRYIEAKALENNQGG